MSTRLTPSELTAWAVKRYAAQHRAWLNGAGSFPLRVPLGVPTEKVFMAEYRAVLAWHTAWRQWAGPGVVEWADVQWQKTGAQRLPVALEFGGAAEVAALAGKAAEWALAKARLGELAALAPAPRDDWGRFYAMVLAYSPADWQHLLVCLAYFRANPASGLYRRQLPLPGVHTKWLEAHESDVTRLVVQLKGLDADKDFFSVCGVRKVPYRVRVRVLCPQLRRQLGGLGDLKVPLAELTSWTLRPSTVLIVENLESGIALEDHPGTLAFIGMGNAVTELAAIPWLSTIPGVYWGDIDTYGLAMFGRLHSVLPLLRPVLMDEPTLKAHRALWTTEPGKSPAPGGLPAAQQALFDLLTRDDLGCGVRLEQERLPWATAWPAVVAALRAAQGEAQLGAIPERIGPLSSACQITSQFRSVEENRRLASILAGQRGRAMVSLVPQGAE